jgi:GrpB-like predicted nucleotidyltransferase (UPF0157 family)/predicted GNAT family N-acyltransferase
MINDITIVNFDPQWASQFYDESQEIKEILGTNCVDIHHIGSTSIYNLSAKPTVDIMVVVRDLSLLSPHTLDSIGYKGRGELFVIWLRHYYSKKAIDGVHNIVNLHIYEMGDPAIQRQLIFKNALLNHDDIKNDYELLKKRLAIEFANDRPGYTEAKSNFINSVIHKYGFEGVTCRNVAQEHEKEFYDDNGGIVSNDLNQKEIIFSNGIYPIGTALVELNPKTYCILDFKCNSHHDECMYIIKRAAEVHHCKLIQIQKTTDIETCQHIRRDVFSLEQNIDPHLDVDGLDLVCNHYIIYADYIPVGTLRARPYKQNQFKLERVAILNEYRGLNLGHQLMKFAMHDLNHIGELVLNSQMSAVPFYEKLGFQCVGEPYVVEGTDIVHSRMVWRK